MPLGQQGAAGPRPEAQCLTSVVFQKGFGEMTAVVEVSDAGPGPSAGLRAPLGMSLSPKSNRALHRAAPSPGAQLRPRVCLGPRPDPNQPLSAPGPSPPMSGCLGWMLLTRIDLAPLAYLTV